MVKRLLLMVAPSVWKDSYELCLFCKVSSFLEKTVFTWSDVVSAAKCSKERTPNHFSQIFSFFDSFYYRPNFYFQWPTIQSKSTHRNCASSVKVTNLLEISIFTWTYLHFWAKCFRECKKIEDVKTTKLQKTWKDFYLSLRNFWAALRKL